MKIIYLGPSPEVNVGGFEPHRQGEVREYPVAVGEDLPHSSRQRFVEYVDVPLEVNTVEAVSSGKEPVKAVKKGKR
ncbi:MAG: hypothetical protein WCK00_05435 [Deltaproteobacteria bacterium]